MISTIESTESTPPSSAHPVRVLVGAQLAAALALVVVMIIGGEIIPPLALFAAALSLIAAAIRRWQARWLFAAATASNALLLALIVSFGAGDLVHPETLLSFIPTLAVIVSLSVAVSAGILGLLRLGESASVYLTFGGAVVMAAALPVSLAATLALDDHARAPGDVVIVAENVEFPKTVTLPAGISGLFLENKDRTRHTIVIEGTDVKQELPGSTNRRIEINFEPGQYRFYCDVPGHDGMEGTLVVN